MEGLEGDIGRIEARSWRDETGSVEMSTDISTRSIMKCRMRKTDGTTQAGLRASETESISI